VSGPSKSLRPRLAALAERGSLELLAPGRGSLVGAYAGLGKVRALPYQPLVVPRGPLAALRTLRRMRAEVRLFRRAFRQARPDLVVVVTAVLPAALIAARLEGLPTVVYVGEIFTKGHVGGPVRALGGRAIARLNEALCDRLVCCSRLVAAQFRDQRKAVTIYPGIASHHAEGDADALRSLYGLDGATPIIAVVGSITAGRGQDVAVRALGAIIGRLPAARLVLAGTRHPRAADHAYADGLQRLVNGLGLADSVVFAEFVEPVGDLYAAADVVVNPARFNEPFGRTAIEALVAGRPVVASAVGAVPEVLRDGRDALLVPPDEPYALAAAIERLVAEPRLGARLVSEGGRRARSEFGVERGVVAFQDLVDEVLAEHAARPARR
jgi:glycosyltransferase involved in cell wall biosynthesis